MLKSEKIRANGFLAVLLILSLLKLVIVSGNEIVAEPDDALTYLRLSTKYWTGLHFPYRPAAYPTWIALVHITGIPLRIAAELLFVFSGCVFASTLRKIGIWSVVACAVFAAVVFDPFSFSMLDRAMSDNFYEPVMILALSFAILAMHAAYENKDKVVWYSAFSGFCFAVLWNTREEYILIFAVLVQMLLSAVILTYLRKLRKKDFLRQVARIILPLILIMTAVNLSVNTFNYIKFSYWGQANTQPAWINGALTALTRIKPSHPIRYAAITKEALQMAYPVSPTLARMREYFDRQENQYVGVKGEIGTAGFIFYLREAVTGISDGSLASARKICADIQKEISTAIQNGKIPSRSVFVNPRVDPDFSVWLPYLPASFLNICKLFVNRYNPVPDNHFVLPPLVVENFNKIANRRINLILKGPMRGWVAIPDHNIARIDVRPTGHDYYHWHKNRLVALSSSCEFEPRPDIEDRYKQQGISMHVAGFSLPALPGRFALNELSLVLHADDGTQIAIMALEQGRPGNFKVPGTDQTGYWCIEDFPLKITNFQRRMIAVQTFIANLYAKGLFGLSLLAIPMTLLTVLWVRKTRFFNILGIALLVNLVLIVMTATMFYSIIDACAWPIVEQPRYLFATMLLYSSFIVLLYGCVVQSAFSKLKELQHKARETTHD